jgi:hypothetical protein
LIVYRVQVVAPQRASGLCGRVVDNCFSRQNWIVGTRRTGWIEIERLAGCPFEAATRRTTVL